MRAAVGAVQHADGQELELFRHLAPPTTTRHHTTFCSKLARPCDALTTSLGFDSRQGRWLEARPSLRFLMRAGWRPVRRARA